MIGISTTGYLKVVCEGYALKTILVAIVQFFFNFVATEGLQFFYNVGYYNIGSSVMLCYADFALRVTF